MKKGMFVLIASLLVGCAGRMGDTGAMGATGPQGPQGPAAPPPPPLTAIQTIVAQENEYRAAIGQALLTPGLDCNLYTVPNTTTQISGASLTSKGSFEYLGVFNQPNASVTVGFNVLPASIQSVFQTWFIMKCTGQFVVADNDWHSFALSSDDGSTLSIGGSLINNDGLHAITTVSAVKFLKYGIYSFELDFFQGGGNQALILDMDGAILGSEHLFH